MLYHRQLCTWHVSFERVAYDMSTFGAASDGIMRCFLMIDDRDREGVRLGSRQWGKVEGNC